VGVAVGWETAVAVGKGVAGTAAWAVGAPGSKVAVGDGKETAVGCWLQASNNTPNNSAKSAANRLTLWNPFVSATTTPACSSLRAAFSID